MTKREEQIVALLERYTELVDPMQAGAGGEGGWGLSMPHTYTDSVRELERLLRVMREVRPSQHWHVSERYIRATSVVRDVPAKRKTKHGKTVTVVERRVIVQWNPAVRAHKVELGIAWLASRWALVHEPMLPSELLVAA